MATVTTLANPAGAVGATVRPMDNSVVPYVIWQEVDLAAAAAAKGSALAAGDVIEVLRVPADTIILSAFAKKTAAFTGTSTDLTLDVGITGVDVDVYVDGWDFDAAALDSYATPLGVQTELVLGTSDTIDILIVTQTGTVTGGKIRVGALCYNLNRRARGVIAQPKS